MFHLWLAASDAEILMHKDGKRAFSIDHGFFLEWNNETIQKDIYAELLMALDSENIEIALYELENLDRKKIVEAFAFIPDEWMIHIKNIAYFIEKILQRRVIVRSMLTAL